jgi:hypothetical protein
MALAVTRWAAHHIFPGRGTVLPGPVPERLSLTTHRPAWVMLVLLLLPSLGGAQRRVVIEGAMGTALNAPSPLVVHQKGYPDIRLTANYETRPLAASPYYQVQIGLWNKEATSAWVVGFLHHKLYLDNPPPEIQRFEITYGYNTLYGGRAWRKNKWVLSTGAGVIIANPLTVVRNKESDLRGGFLSFGWAGATVYGSVQRRLNVSKNVFFGIETKVTASMAWIEVADGNARVPNLALHFLGSFGFGL